MDTPHSYTSNHALGQSEDNQVTCQTVMCFYSDDELANELGVPEKVTIMNTGTCDSNMQMVEAAGSAEVVTIFLATTPEVTATAAVKATAPPVLGHSPPSPCTP